MVNDPAGGESEPRAGALGSGGVGCKELLLVKEAEGLVLRPVASLPLHAPSLGLSFPTMGRAV